MYAALSYGQGPSYTVAASDIAIVNMTSGEISPLNIFTENVCMFHYIHIIFY